MRRVLVPALGIVVVGCSVGLPSGRRGKHGLYRDLVLIPLSVTQHQLRTRLPARQ